MTWIRTGSAVAALGIHAAALALLAAGILPDGDTAALESGQGGDDLSVVASVALQSEDSLGLDATNAPRSDASAGGPLSTEVKEEVKKEDEIVELPPEKTPEETPFAETPEKKDEDKKPSTPAPVSDAQEEERAPSRAFEARQSDMLSRYNSRIYHALMKKALRPLAMQKGRVVLELTLGPTGELLNHRVIVSSGMAELDKIAMISLERAAPFPPLPQEISKISHTLRVPFEYTVKMK